MNARTYKNGISKNCNFLNANSDDNILSRFTNKTWVEIYDQSGGNYNVNKEIRTKIRKLRSDLCDYSDVYIFVKGDTTLEGGNDANKKTRNLGFRKRHHLAIAFQKLMVKKLIMQKI